MKIKLIEEPVDLTPSKLLPYSMMGLAGLIVIYSLTSGTKKEEHGEEVEEELEEEVENEQQEVK
jgi:hypothetical protein